jgi:hypothetical protein
VPKGWKFWPDKTPGPVDEAYVQRRWIRPYRPGPVRVGASLVAAVATAFVTFSGFIATLELPSRPERLVGGIVTLLVAGSLALLAGRLLSAGVWVNDFGVRILGIVKRRQFRWDQVADVRRVHGPTRILGTPLRRDGDAVWLVLRDGSDLETSLTDVGPDFVGRAEAYDIAAGAVERWLVGSRPAPPAPPPPAPPS